MPAEVVSKSGPGAAPVVAAPKTVVPTPVAPVESPEAAAFRVKQETAEHSMRLKEVILNREAQKFKTQREAEKKTWGEKLSQVERFEKLKANAKLNPDPFLKELLGVPNPREYLNELWISGGAAPADIVAAKVAELEDKFTGELSKRDEAMKKEREANQAEQRKASEAHAARQVVETIASFWQANLEEYPAIAAEAADRNWTAEQVASIIAQEVKSEWDATSKFDADGNMTSPGKADPKGVAEKWEAGLLSRSKKIASLPKYAAPAATKSDAQPQRRTLTNGLTGSTETQAHPETEAERMQRALERRQAVIDSRAKRT